MLELRPTERTATRPCSPSDTRRALARMSAHSCAVRGRRTGQRLARTWRRVRAEDHSTFQDWKATNFLGKDPASRQGEAQCPGRGGSRPVRGRDQAIQPEKRWDALPSMSVGFIGLGAMGSDGVESSRAVRAPGLESLPSKCAILEAGGDEVAKDPDEGLSASADRSRDPHAAGRRGEGRRARPRRRAFESGVKGRTLVTWRDVAGLTPRRRWRLHSPFFLLRGAADMSRRRVSGLAQARGGRDSSSRG